MRRAILAFSTVGLVATTVAVGVPPWSLAIAAVIGGAIAGIIAARTRAPVARWIGIVLLVAPYTVATKALTRDEPFEIYALRLTQGGTLALLAALVVIAIEQHNRPRPAV